MIIRPAKSIKGEITLPGDKSISHRAAIIAALAEGESRIENYSTGADCTSTLKCLQQLGVGISQEGSTLTINGVGRTGFLQPKNPLDCGNSGTTMRLLAGVLAGQGFESILTGDESLLKRPMKRIIEPLNQMGASVESQNGFPPLAVQPVESLKAIDHKTMVASAQVKSCVLLAGLFASGETTIRETIGTRDHTEIMLRGFGAEVRTGEINSDSFVTVSGGAALSGQAIVIPGDISSAAFFLAAAASLDRSNLTIKRLGCNPTRTAIFDVLSSCGVHVAKTTEEESLGEPSVTVTIDSSIHRKDKLIINGQQTAELIDELPILAVLGSQLGHGIEVRDAGELRVKETDRIKAVVENLRRMKADVEEFEDGFFVHRSDLKGAEVDPFDDHRIAMAFAIAGLLADGETTIKDPECVDISFPGFFEMLESVVKR